MSHKIEAENFIQDLERVAKVRSEVAAHLGTIAETLEKAESEGKNTSGKLGLDREIEDIKIAGKNLRLGVFRLMVLGDMKRGKSTFLNALIGENILPSDVNPCTALLTVLKFGSEKKVTIHFNDEKKPLSLDFKSFKRNYTIDPAEAKRLEQEKKQAFPDIDYAVVEYPLPILEKGIEIVDSPGLNDTEARNELSLGYINNCHAILFVMRATQPCTLGERRYLENYIKGRGLSVFFLINAWDQVQESLIDPDDREELKEAEVKLRRVFQANLHEYCVEENKNIYQERVFELSSILALRRRLKNPSVSLQGTGFPEFFGALNRFLTQERAAQEFQQAKTLAHQADSHLREAIARRTPLLEQNIEELKNKINSVAPEFHKLAEIRDQFQSEIRTVRDKEATEIAHSFRSYVLDLEHTFESDFLRYQPDMKFLDFINPGKREAFEIELKKGFEQYISDKLAAWTITVENKMDAAFLQLSRRAAHYGASYTKVTDKITEKLTGKKVKSVLSVSTEDNAPSWAKWAMGLFSLARGNIAGIAMAGAGFDWKNILLNLLAVGGIYTAITFFTGITLGPIGLALLGLGVGVMQADEARKKVVQIAKKELVKHLPEVANEQWQPIYDAIKECFDTYEGEVKERIDDDIKSRKSELDNLLKQKQEQEINNDAELARFQRLETDVSSECKKIAAIYQDFMKAIL
ncbi:MAG: dynamin [Okeania sp. SIO2C9]|uniref:dynamin family protein n=1 Tax=Okeania sp. SIO2C9 TaxID=2607791 RepID=UPI0013C1C868|nr:dynamin family protein [Okeania sp. SIO2C9]NEQ71965.1 dynamin [Okeania sp. SIO2C9]